MKIEIGDKVFAEVKNGSGHIIETISGLYRGIKDVYSMIEQADGEIQYVEYWLVKSQEDYNQMIAKRNAPPKIVEMVRCACGHTIPRSLVMSSSHGTCCPDCYDDMED